MSVADDHPRVREGLRLAIEDAEGLTLVGEAVDGRDLTAQLAEHLPDVVVTDLGMPHFDLPQQQIADWRATYPTMKILVHTAYRSAALARLLLDAGADTVGGHTGPPGGWRTKTTESLSLAEHQRPWVMVPVEQKGVESSEGALDAWHAVYNDRSPHEAGEIAELATNAHASWSPLDVGRAGLDAASEPERVSSIIGTPTTRANGGVTG